MSKHAIYIGPATGWNVRSGMGALVRPAESPDMVYAQFDDHHAQRQGKDLAFGWHLFPAKDFKIDEVTQ